MWRGLVFCVVGAILASCSSTPDGGAKHTTPLDRSVEELRDQIVASLSSRAWETVTEGEPMRAVIAPLPTVEGKENLLGKLLAEELIARLHATGTFLVVERSRIEDAMKELEFQMSELVDPSTAARLGVLVGAHVVFTGTVADFGETVRINGRLVDVETAKVFATAQSTLEKDESLQHFLRNEEDFNWGRREHQSRETRSGFLDGLRRGEARAR